MTTSRRVTPVIVYVLGLVSLILCARIGVKFPDADLGVLRSIPGIVHRSFLTHGLLVPVLLFLLVRRYPNPIVRLGVIGFCTALAVHLSYDLFPNGYNGRWCWGYGCVHVPIVGQTSPLFSWLWIAGGILVSLYIGLKLVENVVEIGFTVGSLLANYWYMATVESHIALNALLAVIIASGIALMLPSEVRQSLRGAYQRIRYKT